MTHEKYTYNKNYNSFFDAKLDVDEINREKRKNYSTYEEFILKAKKTHGNKYDYSSVKYINYSTKVLIYCNEHNFYFWQTPINHYSGWGCPKCGSHYMDNDYFKERAGIIHCKKYNYSKVKYTKSNEKIIIVCPEHGEFKQTPSHHLNGGECPFCNVKSSGELFIGSWLNQNNIAFEEQKTFPNCKNRKKLRYDFYLPNQKLLIEYDGQQHYSPVNYFGGKNTFKYLQTNDKLKTEYALNNNINLLRISYIERKNLSEILKNNIVTI
jgi:hypothetical protein